MKTLTKESQVKRILTQRQNKKPCTRHQNERACLKAEHWQHSVGLSFKRQWNVRCCPGISVHLLPPPPIPCVWKGEWHQTPRGKCCCSCSESQTWSRVCSSHSRTRSSCPTECSPQRCSWKLGSNGSRLKEILIFELILGCKIGAIFGEFNVINSKFWRMSPPEWPWGF